MFQAEIEQTHRELIKAFSQKGFRLDDKIYKYYRGDLNYAYRTERSVELPVIKRLVDNCPGRILEVGNVLTHYYPINHTVIDKYEQAPNVINVDVCDYAPPEKYDLIVSISTLEHVGYDDDGDKHKICRAFDNLLSLLKPRGLLAFTVPTGYNTDFDRFVLHNRYGFRLSAMERDNLLNDWHQVSLNGPLARYNKPFQYGNMVIYGYYRRHSF